MSILGPNGAGKSTLLACVAGLFPLKQGNVFLSGISLSEMKPSNIAKIIGFVPQTHTPAFDFTVEEFVLLGRSPHIGMIGAPSPGDREIALEALHEMGIENLRDRYYTRVSGGERQLVMIARALAQQPRILLLDEPTAHLDYGNQLIMVKRVEKLVGHGYSIIMTTHFPDQVFMCSDKVAVIKDHTLLEYGPPLNVLTEERLSSVYGVDISLLRTDLQKRPLCVPDYDSLELPDYRNN